MLLNSSIPTATVKPTSEIDIQMDSVMNSNSFSVFRGQVKWVGRVLSDLDVACDLLTAVNALDLRFKLLQVTQHKTQNPHNITSRALHAGIKIAC